jgi:hypothetical protein
MSEFSFGGSCSLSAGMRCLAHRRTKVIIRTTRTTISFSRSFKLRDLDDIQPAGDYLLDTDEELIEGLSRLAYRRVATLLHLPSTLRPQGRAELFSVSPAELDTALEKDRIGRVE